MYKETVATIDLSKYPLHSTNNFYARIDQLGPGGESLPYLHVGAEWAGITGGDATNDVNMQVYLARRRDGIFDDDNHSKRWFYRVAVGAVVGTDDKDLFAGAGPITGSTLGPYILGNNSGFNQMYTWPAQVHPVFHYFRLTNAALTAFRHDAGIITLLATAWD